MKMSVLENAGILVLHNDGRMELHSLPGCRDEVKTFLAILGIGSGCPDVMRRCVNARECGNVGQCTKHVFDEEDSSNAAAN